MIGILLVIALWAWIVSALYRAGQNQQRDKTVSTLKNNQEILADEFRKQQVIQKEQAELAEQLLKEQKRQAEQLEKHEEQILKLSYKIEKCEDDIAHFTKLLDTLTVQRDSYQAELDDVNEKLEIRSIGLNPDRIAHSVDFRKWESPEKAMEYAEKVSQTIGEDKRKAAKIEEQLSKKKTTLENKIITLDGKIYSAEQKIKKAEHEKFMAEQKLA